MLYHVRLINFCLRLACDNSSLMYSADRGPLIHILLSPNRLTPRFSMDDNTGGILLEGENLKTAQSLCKHCRYIFDHWEEVVEDEYQARFLHCDNIFALQVSAARGCPLCGQFLRNLVSRGELETAQNATIDLLNNGLIAARSWIRVVSFHRIISSQILMPADC